MAQNWLLKHCVLPKRREPITQWGSVISSINLQPHCHTAKTTKQILWHSSVMGISACTHTILDLKAFFFLLNRGLKGTFTNGNNEIQ